MEPASLPDGSDEPEVAPERPWPEDSQFGVRCGEKILSLFDRLFPGKAPELSRSDAVVSGLGSALGKVILGVTLIAVCIGVSYLWVKCAWEIESMLPSRLGHFGRSASGMGAVLVWAMAAGGVMIVSFTDEDNKFRILSWCCFLLIAAGSRVPRSPLLPILALLIGQFAIHYFVHGALKTRERKAAWMRQMERDEQREDRTRAPNLQRRYGGVRGFVADDSNGDPPASA